MGLCIWYLKDVPLRCKLIGKRFHRPASGLAAQLFSTLCRVILKRLGPVEGKTMIREAVESL